MELRELRDIIIAATVLAAVFAYSGLDAKAFEANLPAAVIGVSLGFILHELSHRYFARKYKMHAEFKLWKFGLALAVLFALISNGGFVFAAPGAVMIYQGSDLWGNPLPLSKKRYGIISIAGPVTNIVIALGFLSANAFYPLELFKFAAQVNIWLAIFNMLPIPPLDGSKVFAWDKRIFVIVIVALIAMFVFL